jgi:acetyl esterase/lipase
MAAPPEPSTWPELSKIDPEFEKVSTYQKTCQPIHQELIHLQILAAMGPIPTLADAPGLEIAQASMLAIWENILKTSPPDYTGAKKEKISIPVRDGTSIPAVVYKPAHPPASASPLIVLYHGGGWVLGFPEAEEPTALLAVREFGAVVVSVDYRMAPQGPFPVPIEDSFDALKWVSAFMVKFTSCR